MPKKEWHDYLTPCKNYNKCKNMTHFRGSLVSGMDSLRREKLGLCVDCWDELKASKDYKKVCERMGWTYYEDK